MLKRPLLMVVPLMVLAAACAETHGPPKLREGLPAPDFSLPSANSGEVSLRDFRGERAALLYFSMGPG
jgi:hypothetical protein